MGNKDAEADKADNENGDRYYENPFINELILEHFFKNFSISQLRDLRYVCRSFNKSIIFELKQRSFNSKMKAVEFSDDGDLDKFLNIYEGYKRSIFTQRFCFNRNENFCDPFRYMERAEIFFTKYSYKIRELTLFHVDLKLFLPIKYILNAVSNLRILKIKLFTDDDVKILSKELIFEGEQKRRLPNLVSFEVRFNGRFRGEENFIDQIIMNAPELRSLNYCNGSLAFIKSFELVQSLSKLKNLSVYESNYQNETFEKFAKFSIEKGLQLQNLELTDVSENCYQSMNRFIALQEDFIKELCIIYEDNIIAPASRFHAIASLKELEILKISIQYVEQDTIYTPFNYSEDFPKLKDLTIYSCVAGRKIGSFFNNAYFNPDQAPIANLTSLTLWRCPISKDSFTLIHKVCPNIKYLCFKEEKNYLSEKEKYKIFQCLFQCWNNSMEDMYIWITYNNDMDLDNLLFGEDFKETQCDDYYKDESEKNLFQRYKPHLGNMRKLKNFELRCNQEYFVQKTVIKRTLSDCAWWSILAKLENLKNLALQKHTFKFSSVCFEDMKSKGIKFREIK